MRAAFGVFGLLVTLAIVALVAKRQMGVGNAEPIAHTSTPVSSTVKGNSQQTPQQVGQAVDAVMQQARPMPDDK